MTEKPASEIEAVFAEAQNPPRKPQKKILIIALIVALVVVGIVTTVIVLANNAQARAEAKEARQNSEEAYASALLDYAAKEQRLQSAVELAEGMLEETTEEQVFAASDLERLATQIQVAETAIDANTFPKKDALDEVDDDELEQMIGKVEAETRRLGEIRGQLEEDMSGLERAIAAKAQADERKRLVEEQKARKQAAGSISYEDLFRAGDSLIGDYFNFEGKIIQAAGSGIYRVNITSEQKYSYVRWQDTVMLRVSGETEQRLLEDDIISFVAASEGLTSYTSVMGATIELPSLSADGADVKIIGRDD